jgi:23S rRNA pseudouridine1911/1915/1917 synthase
VVYEDDELVVIDKPAGLVVHPGNGNASGTLLNALLHHAPQLAGIPRAGIVHRLDKDTSGLLVVAKTLTAQTDLVRQMQARSVRRHYLALALGTVERDGTVDAPLGRHAVQRTKMAIVRAGGKEARTHYAVLERFAKATLLECRLETGRTHQIRVHLASIKHPLAGDPVYGKTKSGDARLDAFPRQALHAWHLALRHPATAEEKAWESPLPADFATLLESLRA